MTPDALRNTLVDPRPGRSLRTLWLAGALLLAASGPAADPPSADDARRQKAAEVQRLQEQLRQAQEELRQLEGSPPAATSPGPSTPSPTNAPLALEPLRADEVIEASVLVAHYHQDPTAADRRYQNRTVRVRGEVAAFEVPLMVRNYELRLTSGQPDLDLACRFNYPEAFRSIFTSDHGRTLVGRTASGALQTLHRTRTPVVLEGRCQGLKAGRVLLTRCRVMP